MKKRILSIIMCILLVALSGCGQGENSGDRDGRSDREQSVDESSGIGAESLGMTEPAMPAEDQYAIYERFLAGEEPLYFREDTYFSNDSFESSFRIEANKPYELYEICNMINIVCNSGAPVNELSNNISYAYIDCGEDGMVELALLFHDLADYYDPEDVTLVIKVIDGRLEVCYDIQPYYRGSREEIQRLIAAREIEIGLTEETKDGSEIEWIPVDNNSYDLIYGVESAPGVSDKARAIEAFRRFLSDKGHLKEVLSDPMNDGLAVNNDGMVDGFFIKDLDHDDIPELLIGMSDAGRSQYVFIYKFDKESGRVKKNHVIYSLGGWFGCDEDTYDTVVAAYPEFADSLLFTDHYVNGCQQVGYNDFGQLVWFDNYAGISLATDIIMFWCDYGSLATDISQYAEDGGYDFEVDLVYYEVTGSRPDAEKALQGYRPFLFYDINQENIDKYLVEDYLGAGMEQYSQQDVTDDRNQFYRLYEEYVRGENLTPTGIFAGQYSAQKYNIDKLVQLGFEY